MLAHHFCARVHALKPELGTCEVPGMSRGQRSKHALPTLTELC